MKLGIITKHRENLKTIYRRFSAGFLIFVDIISYVLENKPFNVASSFNQRSV